MTIKNILTVVALMASTVFSVKAQNDIVLAVNSDSVTLEEFNYVIHKNNKSELSKSDVQEYLDLYVNFKLKVAEAYYLGYDKKPYLVKELDGYKSQLEKPYLTDTSVTTALINEGYVHMLEEIHARHILIKVDETASPEDSLIAYNKIKKIRSKFLKGEDFISLAKEYSEGPSSVNGGDLGYFTAFDMLYPFEVAAYNTNINEVSSIVRTKYGYHILYVEDKRDAEGEINVAQIFLSTTDLNTYKDSLKVEEKINRIYSKLSEGEDFAKLAKVYSGDYTSAKKGGVLKTFSKGDVSSQMQIFADTCFNLKYDGQISKPFLSPLGWHIVKRINYLPVGDFQSTKIIVQEKVKKDPLRMMSTQKSFLSKLKKEYNLKINKREYKKVSKITDSTLLNGNWKPKIGNSEFQKPLVTFSNQVLTSFDFIKYLINQQKKEEITSVQTYLDIQLENFIEGELISYEKSVLEQKYPEYRFLIKEYTEGILLFELVQDSIWKKAELDTSGLKMYFEANQSNYAWGERINAEVYNVENEDVAKLVLKDLKKGYTNDEIDEKYNSTGLVFDYRLGDYEIKKESFLKDRKLNKGVNDYFVFNNMFYIVVINEFLKPETKKISDVKGIVISDYQQELERKWIEYLKKKYPVYINNDILLNVK
jgi:peptidyl-prolyl cis-trans isomerase SurA